jgi:hypothetical protein
MGCGADSPIPVGFFIMNTGQIVKSRSTEKFTTLPNDVIKSKELTLSEKGLLSYLLSLPADWVIYKQNLYNSLPDKEGTINKVFKGLQDKKYIISVRVHDKGTGKFIGWNHVVYDIPADINNNRDGQTPTSGFTDIGESGPILKTNVLQKTNNKLNTNRIQSKPTQDEVISYFLEKGSTELLAKQAYEYYEVADWYDAKGNKVKNWKQKMLSVWINNNNFTKITKTTNNGKTTSDYYRENYERNLTWANEWDILEGRQPFSGSEENR